jgi:Fe-S cluster assembly iron-binding protein IscA
VVSDRAAVGTRVATTSAACRARRARTVVPERKGAVLVLAITENAADAIRGIVAGPDVPEGAGLRIATQPESSSSGTLEVSVADVPAESDQVVDEGGARVFVEEHAVPLLDDKLLDAHVDGTRVGFTISDQL